MIPSGAGNPRRLFVIACAGVALALLILGWYATRTVAPDCVGGVARLTDGSGRTLPDAGGRVWSAEELADLAYREAVASGRCDPPRARWKHWLD